jgi:hypothetical protein
MIIFSKTLSFLIILKINQWKCSKFTEKIDFIIEL